MVGRRGKRKVKKFEGVCGYEFITYRVVTVINCFDIGGCLWKLK